MPNLFSLLDYISDFGKMAPWSVIASQNQQANKIKVAICFGLFFFSVGHKQFKNICTQSLF